MSVNERLGSIIQRPSLLILVNVGIVGDIHGLIVQGSGILEVNAMEVGSGGVGLHG